MSARPQTVPSPDARAQALAARAAGDRPAALQLFRDAGDPWSRSDAALELLTLGHIAAARREAEALRAEQPSFAPAHRTLGLVARREGDHEAALAHFQDAATLAPADLWSRQDAAAELRALGRSGEAETAFRTLAAGTPLPHALRELSRTAGARGDGEAALAAIRVAADLLPGDPWFALEFAQTLLATGREEDAERTAEALAQRQPGFADTHRFLARLARQRGEADRELALLRRVAELEPAAGPLDLADALLRAGRREEAETLAARHLVHDPGDVRALRILARGAQAAADPARALAHLRAASFRAPADAGLLAEHAALAFSLGCLAEAEAQARAALAADDAAVGARRTLTACLRATDRRDEARRLAIEGWSDGAGPARAGLDLAADLRTDGDLAEAEALYGELIGRSEVAADALVELALLLRRSHGAPAARERLSEALRLEPAHPRAWLCSGDLAREGGDGDEAERCYRRALDARPRFGWALAGLAQVAEARGLTDEADRFWREAMAADPAEAWFTIALAARCGERGDFAQAHALLERVPDDAPRAPEAALSRARLLRLQGDPAAASRLLQMATRRWPHRPEAWIEASEAALHLGNVTEAMVLLRDGETACPDHPAFPEAQARHALSRDDLAGAATHLARAQVLEPGRLWPGIALARLAAQGGRPDEAHRRFAAIRARFGGSAEAEIAEADIDRQSGRPERAGARLRRALRRAPGHPLLAFQAAMTALDAGRTDLAEALLSRLPDTSLAERGRQHFVTAQIASARWDFETAMREGERAVSLLPQDGWVRNRLAHAALLALKTERASAVLADLARLEAGANALRGKSANPSQSHYGQLLDEFRLDAEALAALRAALALPPAERLAAIAAAVRDFPDATAPAILFFIEERRTGGAASRPGSGDAIPRVVHQFWTDPEPPGDVASYLQTWRDHNSGFRHRLWSDASARAFLVANAAPAVALAFDRAREPAMRADLFRLALLAHEGGVWADADDRCRRPIETLLATGTGLVAYQEDLGSLGNNWLAARPGHPILRDALNEAVAAVNRGDGDILWLLTGPGLLTRVAARAACAGAADLTVLDRAQFLGFVSIHCLAAYKSSERHWSRTAFGGSRRAHRAASGGAGGDPRAR